MLLDETAEISPEMNAEKKGFDAVDAGPHREHISDKNHSLQAAWYDDVFVVYCCVVYIADIITDTLVSVKYFNKGDYIWFSLTLACVIGASVVSMIFSLKWFYEDLAPEVDKTKTVVIHLFQLGPLQRYWDAYWNGKRTRKEEENSSYCTMYTEQWRDIAMLRLFEAFIESAPQLVLQLYILAYNRHFDKEEDWLTAFSACISLLSLSTSIVSYSKALRDASKNKGKMSWWGFACQLVWRLSMVASRIVTLVLFASVYRSWILLVIGVHWFAMTVWVFRQKTSICKTASMNKLFTFVIGFIYIFCFFNVKEGFSRRRLIIFYVCVFIEDCVLMALWLPYRHEYGVVFVAALVMVFGGFFLGVIAMFLYYQYYHPSLPKQGICVRTEYNVPSTQGIVFRYFCCNDCCHIKCIEDQSSEVPPGRNICIDIPASRGSVGRSVSNKRPVSPTFESEFLQHRPSELQRRYSLEKQKMKKQKAERSGRSYNQENGIENTIHVHYVQGIDSSESGQQMNVVNQNLQGNHHDVVVEVHSNGFCNGVEPGHDWLISNKKEDNQVDCGTDNEKEKGTKIVYGKKCEGGLHHGTDDGKETGTSPSKSKKTCDDGLHCGTDDEEETGTNHSRSKKTCDDGLHCGTDDEEETGTNHSRSKKTCDDGLHCGTDDEEETGTNHSRSKKTCDDGLHCGTDDEEETGTNHSRSKKTCDDGLHCGTDDEEETGTNHSRSKKTCEDGLHYGTEDEKETGTSLLKGKKTCDDGLHYGSDNEEEIHKGETKPRLSKIQSSKHSLSLNFQHRYSIVSDCISLSSSSTDTGDDEPFREDESTRTIQCVEEFENFSNAEQVKDDSCELTNVAHQENICGPSTCKKGNSHRNKQTNRVSFPNFVATTLKRGKFSSLRVSREDFGDETTMDNKRHTIDFSDLTSNRTCNKNRYLRIIQNLKPKRFGSVREELSELTSDEPGCAALESRETQKSSSDKDKELMDNNSNVWIQRNTGGMQDSWRRQRHKKRIWNVNLSTNI